MGDRCTGHWPLAKILLVGFHHPRDTDFTSGTPSPPTSGTGGQGANNRGRGARSGPASGPCLPSVTVHVHRII